MTPFWEICDQIGPYFMTQLDLIDPLFLQKKKVSVSLSDTKRYLDLILVKFFTKMYYLTIFKHLASFFSLIFYRVETFVIGFKCV